MHTTRFGARAAHDELPPRSFSSTAVRRATTSHASTRTAILVLGEHDEQIASAELESNVVSVLAHLMHDGPSGAEFLDAAPRPKLSIDVFNTKERDALLDVNPYAYFDRIGVCHGDILASSPSDTKATLGLIRAPFGRTTTADVRAGESARAFADRSQNDSNTVKSRWERLFKGVDSW